MAAHVWDNVRDEQAGEVVAMVRELSDESLISLLSAAGDELARREAEFELDGED